MRTQMRTGSRVRSMARRITSQNPADMNVDISNISVDGNILTIEASVGQEVPEAIDYTINVNDTATGATTDRSGSLDASTGSFPGDVQFHEITFGIDDDIEGGLITVQITSPDEYVGAQAQQEWENPNFDDGDGGTGGGGGGGSEPDPSVIEINQCSSEVTSSGSLTVDYSLAPTGNTGGTVTADVFVGGQQVSSSTHSVPRRGGGYDQTIPRSDLPLGENQQVEISLR